jgi:phosphate transport system substrate-binding protein
MTRRSLGLLTLLLAVGAGCGTDPLPSSGSLRISGSNTVFTFVKALAEGYHQRSPNVTFRISADGTARGIKFVGEQQVGGLGMPLESRVFSIPAGMTGPTINGEPVDIGLSSRLLLHDEREAYTELVVHTFAVDGIAVATSRDVQVRALTMTQLRAIYAGRIANWQDVGGPDAPIYVITRNPISGTAGAWQELVMGSDMVTDAAHIAEQDSDVPGALTSHHYAIGYLSSFLLDPAAFDAVSIDGIPPTEENIADQVYPIRRPFLFVTHGQPTPVQQSFIDFAYSAEGAEILRRTGAVPVGARR